MHTREQTLERLREIEEFVQSLPATQIRLSDWVSETDVHGCGTVCCVVGWLAEKRMFGMAPYWSNMSHNPVAASIRTVPGLVPKDGVPTTEVVFGYRAAEIMLFGHDAWPAANEITMQAFTGAGKSRYDDAGQFVDDRAVFLARIPKVVDDINQLYDRGPPQTSWSTGLEGMNKYLIGCVGALLADPPI